VKTYLSFALLLAITCNILSAQTVPDPVAAYTKDRRFFRDDKILRLDIDLNHDGGHEVFLACTHPPDPQGYFWSAWTELRSGIYQRITDDGILGKAVQPITFSPSFYYGQIRELNRYGIVAYYHGGGGMGAFGAIFYDREEKKIKEVIFADVGRGDDKKDQDLRNRYSQSSPTEGQQKRLQETSVQDLAKKYDLLITPETFNEAVKNGTY
jgi:hypothetical protein